MRPAVPPRGECYVLWAPEVGRPAVPRSVPPPLPQRVEFVSNTAAEKDGGAFFLEDVTDTVVTFDEEQLGRMAVKLLVDPPTVGEGVGEAVLPARSHPATRELLHKDTWPRQAVAAEGHEGAYPDRNG